MATLHFPGTGLSPRTFDDYDALCLKLYNVTRSKKLDAIKVVENKLRDRFGSDDLDMDFSHGMKIARNYKIIH